MPKKKLAYTIFMRFRMLFDYKKHPRIEHPKLSENCMLIVNSLLNIHQAINEFVAR